MNRRTRDQNGVALATVVMVLAIVAIIASGMVLIAITQTSTIKNNERAVDAFVYAEAGIEWAQAHLLQQRSFLSGTYTVTVASAEVSTVTVYVQISNPSTTSMTAWVTSQAQIAGYGTDFPEARRAIYADFELGGGYSRRPITANGTIGIEGNSPLKFEGPGVDEMKAANLPIVLSNSPTTNPSVSIEKLKDSTLPIGYVAGGGVGGAIKNGIEVLPDNVPDQNWDEWKRLAENPSTTHTGTYYEGNYSLSETNPFPGETRPLIIYVTGTTYIPAVETKGSFKPNYSFTLVSEGPIILTQNANITFGGDCALITRGDIKINQGASATFSGATLLYAAGDFKFESGGAVKLNGGGSISVQGDLTWDYSGDPVITYKDVGNSNGLIPGLLRDFANRTIWKEVNPQ